MIKEVNFLPDNLKCKIVQEYLAGGVSQKSLMIKYNFRGKQSINNWIRKFGLSNDIKNYQEPMKKLKKQLISTDPVELKLKKLEEELRVERLRTTALSTMIDIAERELKVDIRKKSGAKR